MTVHDRIRRALEVRGYTVQRLTYERPVYLEMGDALGGWIVYATHTNGTVANFGTMNSAQMLEGIDKL